MENNIQISEGYKIRFRNIIENNKEYLWNSRRKKNKKK